MITTIQARHRQRQLQQQGATLLERFNIAQVLADFGDVQSIGSYSYGLMQVPDLDFKIYCRPINQSAIRQLGARMAEHPDVMGIRLLDFTKRAGGGQRGVYLNVFPHFEGQLWKLDFLFLHVKDREQRRDDAFIARLRSLSLEERDAILLLKARLLELGEYSHPTIFHNSAVFHGADVYQAVIDGARTVDDLIHWKASEQSHGIGQAA